MSQYPSTAFVLALAAAVFHAVGGFISRDFYDFVASALDPLGSSGTILAAIFVLLALLGAYLLYTGRPRMVTYGGVLTILVSISAVPTGWGIILGSILGFIAGILAMIWHPRSPPLPTTVPTPISSE